jgi:hypothetical protein
MALVLILMGDWCSEGKTLTLKPDRNFGISKEAASAYTHLSKENSFL